MAAPSPSIADALLPDLSVLKPGEPHSFNPDTNIPSQAGKVSLITGGNSGIGRQTAIELARHEPAQIWIVARDVKSGHDTVDEIRAIAPNVDGRFVECDLTSFVSIRMACKTVPGEAERLNVLLLNAGIISPFPPQCLHSKSPRHLFHLT